MNTRVTIEVSPEGVVSIISTERVDGQSAAANVETAGRVKLDPKAPNFDARKAELKASGYKWNGKTETWVRPANGSATGTADQPAFTGWFGDVTEIQLSLDDVDFDAKLAALKKAGFKWDYLCNCVRPANGSVNGTADQPAFTDWLGITTEITLSQDDVDFDMKKAALPKAGFKWARPFTWVKPANGSATGAANQPDFKNWLNGATEITLSQDDVDFDMKKAALTKAGFKWAHPFTWVKPVNGSANGTVRPITRHKSAQWVHGRYTG